VSKTSSTNEASESQPYFGMPMDSYPGRQSPPSSLNGESTLSMVGPYAHNRGPSGPPSDRSTPYAGQSRVTQRPPQGSHVLPDVTGQSGDSTGPFGPLADRPTAQVGPSGAPEITCDPPSAEGRHKYNRSPKPQEPKKSHVPELIWPTRANLLFAFTRTRHKRKKLSSHLILLSVIKCLMSCLNMVILNCHM
jgi:hypothetical protein